MSGFTMTVLVFIVPLLLRVSSKFYMVKFYTSSERASSLENLPEVRSQIVTPPTHHKRKVLRAGDYNYFDFDDYNVEDYDMHVMPPEEYMLDLYFDPDSEGDYGK